MQTPNHQNQTSPDLAQVRQQIDRLDSQLAELLEQRLAISREVAACKLAQGLPVYHPQREEQVIRQVTQKVKPEYSEAVEAIYHCIMDQSKRLQQKLMAGEADTED